MARFISGPRKRLNLMLDKGEQVALMAESSNLRQHSNTGHRMSHHQIAYFYEIVYLRSFSAWEDFLESVFLRLMCGYRCKLGREVLQSGIYERTIEDARRTLYGGNSYLLWHNPMRAIQRCRRVFISQSTTQTSVLEGIVSANLAILERLSHVRHRIAHDHVDCRAKMDAASLHFVTARFPGARAGLFLRSHSKNSPPNRVLTELHGYLRQIATNICD